MLERTRTARCMGMGAAIVLHVLLLFTSVFRLQPPMNSIPDKKPEKTSSFLLPSIRYPTLSIKTGQELQLEVVKTAPSPM